ncbi:tail fiber protein H [Ectopseudomonas mendocina]|uniref:Tail fiber protein H n=1 Tax=Ectopseudomonas mendocina TaxID=300 RepID=A0A379PLG5_ECTME|nr:tail fiber domain-containing protein [Pseudomonas mendocina]SUE95810.1 tail fiber protein H [Pseudomonas mendocina]
MSWYRAGTINLTNGSVDVIGVGTAFKSEVRFSDILLVDGKLSEIVRIDSDTALKLATPWEGPTVSGVSFAVIRNLTNASNYDLMKKIEEFLTDRQRSLDEFVDWINATPVTTGAPDAGKFPLTDRYGVKVFCKSPQQLEYEAEVRLNRQDELIDETEAILTESEARLAAIGDQQAWANQILGYKNDAAASATLAQKWADNPENTAVTTGKYSAKHHAIKAAASQADVTTRQADVTTKHNSVIALEQQAQAARTAAQTSETNAKTSETNAAGSATGAASSASAAAASKSGADAAKTAAEAAKTAAQTSEANAASSATAAASSASASATSANTSKDWAEKTTGAVTGSQYSAKYHSQQAQSAAADVTTKQADVIARQADVQTRQSDVISRQNNVISLESSALSSKNAAASSATSAGTKATEASNSATSAATSATNALVSENKASKWAEEAENVTVETGKYSAKHHATKAAASATAAASSASAAATSKTGADSAKAAAETAKTAAETARNAAQVAKADAEAARDTAIAAAATLTGNLVEYGSIDLSSGAYPATPTNAGFWKVTVGGSVGGVDYGVGDTLVYSKNLDQFYKIDNTESVTSVNGKTGAVALVPSDIGALEAGGTAVAAQKLSTARTISATGDATGSASFDGSANISISLTVVDNSHNHTIGNVTGLQAALDAKQPSLGFAPIQQGTGAGQGNNAVKMGWSASGLLLQVDSTDFANVWPISISKNAATATKLQTARTINGVAFDGSANITVEDSTKLPLTGGDLTGDLSITKSNPWITLDSDSAGGNGVEQGAGISIGESGKKGAASLHLTYTGDGYGHIGMGAVDPTSGIPAYRAMSFFYQNANVTFHGTISGNGSGLTSLNASQLTSGTIPDARLTGTYTGVNITGNAATATKLATARTINGVAFDGSANISIQDPTSIAKAGDTITGKISVGNTANRSAGMYGIYDSTKTGHVWSMGTGYAIPDDGTDFGTLYGMAYKHTNNATGGTMAGGHQIVFCNAGTPGAAIGMAGNIWTSGNVTAYSDIRVKTNIQVIPEALCKVMQLRGVTYERTDRNGERQTGLIAQEVQKVMPEAVSGDDMLSVAYGNLVGLLVEAIKELKAEVDELKMKVAA